ncbi:MAG: sigma-54-dependent Fis family transcriptional regulator [Bacteroidales bacterium]|nr:sigma-54-dependent Fis family transcriptional regulator [Bacteroidales bacterium]
MDVQSIKRTFGIIGNDPQLLHAIEIAAQVASTDLTVLITGESGTGKDVFPKIIHQNSARKHGQYFAVNCGAIPEGTIDSELFGHEKGSFTGAIAERKGYFEIADGGTLFLDEVAEMPLPTQARLLRVLENGEYIRVGGSKVMKTNVRVVAATNVDLPDAIQKGKFRKDLYYRLNTIPIHIPALRERKEDIYLLFRKFASDFAERSRIPVISLTSEAVKVLENYRWDGNVRQLKNVTEQISIIEQQRVITDTVLERYLPNKISNALPVLFQREESTEGMSERDLLYKVLFEMKHDIAELRHTVNELTTHQNIISTNYIEPIPVDHTDPVTIEPDFMDITPSEEVFHEQHEPVSLSLEQNEIEMIKKALEKYNGKRKDAARELGISERTLYRKINEFGIK